MIIKETAGIIPIYQKDTTNYYLIVQGKENGFWNFPKGQKNSNETIEECAQRELKEETGIVDIDIHINTPQIIEFDTKINGQQAHKKMTFFPGYVMNMEIFIQKEEIQDYLWGTYEECIQKLSFDDSKDILSTIDKIKK